jgi:hypothetical protein
MGHSPPRRVWRGSRRLMRSRIRSGTPANCGYANSICWTSCGKNRFGSGFSSTGTLACVIFAIVLESVADPQPTNPHRQECLCYSTFSADSEAPEDSGAKARFPSNQNVRGRRVGLGPPKIQFQIKLEQQGNALQCFTMGLNPLASRSWRALVTACVLA